MYLSNLKLWNFRKYSINGSKFELAEPGLSVEFNEGVNVLVGENDSGKTSIIDAIKYVLRTHSGEFIQIDEKDFHKTDDNRRSDELKIECIFKGFSDAEAAHFLEWIGFDNNNEYFLKIWLYARRRDNAVIQNLRAGVDIEGSYIEGEARELLKVIYLKPLRDALSEMTAGRSSRLAQILKNLKKFRKEKDETGKEKNHELENQYKTLKTGIDNYFSDGGDGSEIQKTINTLLSEDFFIKNDSRKATISLTESELTEILRQLNLILEANKSGLGSLNLLFIAAEFLYLNDFGNGLKLTLIEEMEAHLHPQYQLRLIDFIQKNPRYGQFILTTHSTTLASKIDLKNLIICKEQKVFPMGLGKTLLEEGDYAFLKRFLDATKANLFFANGVIIVEGDAENLLLPTIAEIIDRPLHKYGVSIVNVGNKAFRRYANIFLRQNNPLEEDWLNIPVSVVTDIDIRPIEYYEDKNLKANDVYIITSEKVRAFEEITDEINFNALADRIFTLTTKFEAEIKSNKKNPSKNLKGGTMDRILEKLPIIKTSINAELIVQLRKSKLARLKKGLTSQKVEGFIAQNWTLEYELALSFIKKELYQALLLAKYLKSNENGSFDYSLIQEITEEVEEFFNKRNGDTLGKIAYDIFKPINDGEVSKAILAQVLAQILFDKKSEIAEKIQTDPYIKYLCDAIYHVTEPQSI